MRVSLVIVIISIFSCNKSRKIYDQKNRIIAEVKSINDSICIGYNYDAFGNIIYKQHIKNGMYYGEGLRYFNNGRVKSKENYINSKKEKWWYIFDSTTQKIVEKKFYINNKMYTWVKLDTNGNCKYYEIRPRLEVNNDTIYVLKQDSIAINFYKSIEKLEINSFSIRIVPFIEGEEYQNVYHKIYKDVPKYIKFNHIYDLYGKVGLYYLEYQGNYVGNHKQCCCDSINMLFGSRFVYII